MCGLMRENRDASFMVPIRHAESVGLPGDPPFWGTCSRCIPAQEAIHAEAHSPIVAIGGWFVNEQFSTQSSG